jgi:hypothetical protein
MEIVGSKAEARRLLEQNRAAEALERYADNHRKHATDVAAPTGAAPITPTAPLVDGIELDYTELASAQAELARHYDQIVDFLAKARELSMPLADGQTPVTRQMRLAFGLRGDVNSGGVQAALQEYLRELDNLRAALHKVAETHQVQDDDAATAMNSGLAR